MTTLAREPRPPASLSPPRGRWVPSPGRAGPPARRCRSAARAGERAQIILHMLDYVAVDYPGRSSDGTIVDQGEYDEQVEFVAQARTPARAARGAAGAGGARRRADRLVEPREGQATRRRRRRALDAAPPGLIRAYGVEVAPKRPPDLGEAASALRRAVRAVPRRRGPRRRRPRARASTAARRLHDAGGMAQRSVYGLYSTITLGVDGTAMAGFAA